MLALALLRWGDDALGRLHGAYVFAWWDSRERRLLLACDRTGGRTLFYYPIGSRLLFANLLDALFVQPDVPRDIDPEKVASSTFFPSYDASRTCFHGIHQLGPAHKLVWTPENLKVERYWQLEPVATIRYSKDADYVDATRGLLDHIVSEHLRVDGPTLCHLSGGLDSSAVAATAARLRAPEHIHTITWRPGASHFRPADNRNVFFDEGPHARAVASIYPNIVAHETEARWTSFEEELRGNIALTGRPPVSLMATAWSAGTWEIAHRLGAKAIVTGAAGNCTLSASALSMLPCTSRAGVPAALADAWLRAQVTPGPMGIARALRGLVSPRWNALLARLGVKPPLWKIAAALRREVEARIDMESIWLGFAAGDKRFPWRARHRVWCMEHTWEGRAWTSPLRWRHGVEQRDPLGDIRLAEFCLALPSNQFTRMGMDRSLARRVLADRLPKVVLHERRKGRQIPEWFDWLTRSRPWLAEMLDGIEASSLGREMIDVRRLRAILDDWPADAEAAEKHYVRLMNVLGNGVALGIYLRWVEGGNR